MCRQAIVAALYHAVDAFSCAGNGKFTGAFRKRWMVPVWWLQPLEDGRIGEAAGLLGGNLGCVCFLIACS